MTENEFFEWKYGNLIFHKNIRLFFFSEYLLDAKDIKRFHKLKLCGLMRQIYRAIAFYVGFFIYKVFDSICTSARVQMKFIELNEKVLYHFSNYRVKFWDINERR